MALQVAVEYRLPAILGRAGGAWWSPEFGNNGPLVFGDDTPGWVPAAWDRADPWPLAAPRADAADVRPLTLRGAERRRELGLAGRREVDVATS